MKSFNKTFAEFSKEDFSEFTANIFANLRQNNKKYKEIFELQKKLKEECPMLEILLEEFHVPKNVTISKKDVYTLRRYFELYFEALNYEYYEIFLRGQKEEYCSLRSKGIIK